VSRPKLLDLFCCAGGAAVGYHRAGFDVVGVDIEPQRHYPFEFHQDDALDVLRSIAEGDRFYPSWMMPFDAVHASPPCQRYSKMSLCKPGLAATYPDLIAPARELLIAVGLPYVMENVARSPLENWVQVCGSGLGLPLQRHRWFESSVPLWGVPCAHGENAWNPAYGHATNRKRRRVPVIGEWRVPKHLQDEAMGIDWMTLKELSEAIPPAYTEHIGTQLLERLAATEAA
jgi:DNA (cytosine-5)-methyltransferase 1